jgi:hypothetical protein
MTQRQLIGWYEIIYGLNLFMAVSIQLHYR